MKPYLTIVFLIIALIGSSSGGQLVNAQMPEMASSCEDNEVRLGRLALQIAKENNNKSVLIILTRRGLGDNRETLSKHRLYNARQYILAKMPSIDPSRLITGEGSAVAGLGRVQFYFRGEMVDELLVAKNKALCVDCCENNPIVPFSSRSRK